MNRLHGTCEDGIKGISGSLYLVHYFGKNSFQPTYSSCCVRCLTAEPVHTKKSNWHLVPTGTALVQRMSATGIELFSVLDYTSITYLLYLKTRYESSSQCCCTAAVCGREVKIRVRFNSNSVIRSCSLPTTKRRKRRFERRFVVATYGLVRPGSF